MQTFFFFFLLVSCQRDSGQSGIQEQMMCSCMLSIFWQMHNQQPAQKSNPQAIQVVDCPQGLKANINSREASPCTAQIFPPLHVWSKSYIICFKLFTNSHGSLHMPISKLHQLWYNVYTILYILYARFNAWVLHPQIFGWTKTGPFFLIYVVILRRKALKHRVFMTDTSFPTIVHCREPATDQQQPRAHSLAS